MISAILPIGLHDAAYKLAALADRLDALDDDIDQRQVSFFRNRFYFQGGGVASSC